MKVIREITLELPDSTKVTLSEEEAEFLYEELQKVLKKYKDWTLPCVPAEPIPYPIPSYPSAPTNPFDFNPPYPYGPSYPPYTIYSNN